MSKFLEIVVFFYLTSDNFIRLVNVLVNQLEKKDEKHNVTALNNSGYGIDLSKGYLGYSSQKAVQAQNCTEKVALETLNKVFD